MKKAIFKWNGGAGALLCSGCHVIIRQGSELSEDDWDAAKRHFVMEPQYCEECKKNETEG